MRWLEIRLQLPGELVEPVAELLSRHCETGAAIEPSRPASGDGPDEAEFIVRAWLTEGEGLVARRERIEVGLWHLGLITPLPPPTYSFVEDQDWNELWKSNYRPIVVGKRLLVVPAWMDPDDPTRIPLFIQPGLAFGTGTHPTTRMCLELLERLIQPDQTVLDLGCGSGILAIAAAKLGAKIVYAFDLDPEAIESARENIARNAQQGKIILFQGSLAEYHKNVGEPIDLLIANITAAVLVQLLKAGLTPTLRADGKLVLSGILAEQLGTVEQAAREQGFRVVRRKSALDWRSLVLESKPPP